MARQNVIIWDDNANRIQELHQSILQALSILDLKADIQINCEAPLLERYNLIGTTPAFQINGGDFWRNTDKEHISVEDFKNLFIKLYDLKLLN